MNENGAQKKLVKCVRVVRGESQCAPKHNGLVTTDRMRRVEAVIRELADVDECVFGVRKKHVVIVARVASRLLDFMAALLRGAACFERESGVLEGVAKSRIARDKRCRAADAGAPPERRHQ